MLRLLKVIYKLLCSKYGTIYTFGLVSFSNDTIYGCIGTNFNDRWDNNPK